MAGQSSRRRPAGTTILVKRSLVVFDCRILGSVFRVRGCKLDTAFVQRQEFVEGVAGVVDFICPLL